MAAEVCSLATLGRWFDWMREEAIFDNTTIVVVSDHSSGVVPELSEVEGAMGKIGRPSSLLLIKPKNGDPKAALKVSDDHLGIVDTMKFIFADVNGSGPIRVNKEVRHTFVPDGLTGNEYRLEHFYEVRGSMFDKNAWKEIEP